MCTVYLFVWLHTQGWTGLPGCLALARWAGLSAGQEGVEWRRGPIAKEGGSTQINYVQGPEFLVTPLLILTGQFADKPTDGQSSHGLVNSQTSQLTDSEFF